MSEDITGLIRVACSNGIITDGRLDMSIAFKNWVMDEQEKEEEAMITELKQKEFLHDIKMTLRRVLSTETMTLDARSKVNNVIIQVNQEIIRIEKLVSDHEQQENAPC